MKIKNNYYYFLVPLGIIFFNIIAYYLCLNSLELMYGFYPVDGFNASFVELIYKISPIYNSLIFPFLLLLIIYTLRSILLIIILQFFTLIMLLTYPIYYKYFLSLPHINLINQIYLLPPVINQVFSQLFGINELIISVCGLLSMGLSIKLSYDIRKKQFNIISPKKLLIFFLIIMTGYFIKGTLINLKRPIHRHGLVDTVRVAKLHGFNAVYLSQFIRGIFKGKKVIAWPGKINLKTQDVIIRAKNKRNVIILQVETLDPQIIDYRLGPKYVMPYLSSLKKQGLFFKYFFSQRRGGGTSDVELSSLTSLIPLNTHSGFRTADYQKITPLSKVLREEGYYCAGIHANAGRYFDRTQSYSLMEFNAFFDQQAFQGEAAGWYSKDKAFFEQTIKILRSFTRPFFAYIITMQSHGPCRNYSIKPDIFDFNEFNEPQEDFQHYILTMHEVDQALEVFITQLEKYGFLKNTILIIYADSPLPVTYPMPVNYHSSYSENVCSVRYTPFHIPLIIIGPDVPSGVKYKVGSHIDIGPTILDLLGIEEPEGWLGSSLLQPGAGKAVLDYGRPYVLINEGEIVVQDHNHDNYLKFIDYSTSILDP